MKANILSLSEILSVYLVDRLYLSTAVKAGHTAYLVWFRGPGEKTIYETFAAEIHRIWQTGLRNLEKICCRKLWSIHMSYTYISVLKAGQLKS